MVYFQWSTNINWCLLNSRKERKAKNGSEVNFCLSHQVHFTPVFLKMLICSRSTVFYILTINLCFNTVQINSICSRTTKLITTIPSVFCDVSTISDILQFILCYLTHNTSCDSHYLNYHIFWNLSTCQSENKSSLS